MRLMLLLLAGLAGLILHFTVGPVSAGPTHDSTKFQLLLAVSKVGAVSVIKDLAGPECATVKSRLISLAPADDNATIVYVECIPQ